MRTEERNPATVNIDKSSTEEMLRMIHCEDIKAAEAVGEVLGSVGAAVDAIADGMKRGGRLIYIGAGTSGRLGVLDAVECPPTYGVSSELVVGIIAGGEKCMFRAAEGEEDSAESGVCDLAEKNPTPNDRVVGISASGNAAYVVSAIAYAKSLGCLTVAITSNSESKLAKEADIAITPNTGAEVITGSTRMKAGTAQKMILNMLSTCTMVKLGNVCQNLMINLRPTNEKLRRRVISIVREICGYDEETAISRLDANGWVIRAVVDECENR